MKHLALLCALLAGCTSTTVYYPNGKPQLRTNADIAQVQFSGSGWAMTGLNHSNVVKARGEAVSGRLTAMGSAVAASGIIALF